MLGLRYLSVIIEYSATCNLRRSHVLTIIVVVILLSVVTDPKGGRKG